VIDNRFGHWRLNPSQFYLLNFHIFSVYTELSSHTTHIKIFIDGCNSIQFYWINKHTISLWLYESPCRSRHVVSCSHQSISCFQTVEVQQVFIVEHYLASHSYLTCQNEFRDTFSRLSCAKQIDNILSGEPFLSLQKLFTGLHQTWGKEWMHASVNTMHISNTYYNIVFVFWFQCHLFFGK
jgi:hypothetical protein